MVDSLTKAPIAGNVIVAIERTDSTGVDRILMQTTADSQGNFRFCPLPTGTFDVVVVSLRTTRRRHSTCRMVQTWA